MSGARSQVRNPVRPALVLPASRAGRPRRDEVSVRGAASVHPLPAVEGACAPGPVRAGMSGDVLGACLMIVFFFALAVLA